MAEYNFTNPYQTNTKPTDNPYIMHTVDPTIHNQGNAKLIQMKQSPTFPEGQVTTYPIRKEDIIVIQETNNTNPQMNTKIITNNNNVQVQIIDIQKDQPQYNPKKRQPIRSSLPSTYYPGNTYIYPYYYDSSGCYYCCWCNGNCCPIQACHDCCCSTWICDPFPCCNGCTGFHCGCLQSLPPCQALECVKQNNCQCCQFLPCCSGCQFCSQACDGTCISALPCCNGCQCGQICQVIPCFNGCECEHIFGCLPCCNDAICNVCECLNGCQICNCVEGCNLCNNGFECLENCECGDCDCNGCDLAGCDLGGCDGCDLGNCDC